MMLKLRVLRIEAADPSLKGWANLVSTKFLEDSLGMLSLEAFRRLERIQQ